MVSRYFMVMVFAYFFDRKFNTNRRRHHFSYTRRAEFLLFCVLNLWLLTLERCIGLILYEMLFRKSAKSLLEENLTKPDWKSQLPDCKETHKKFKSIYKKWVLLFLYSCVHKKISEFLVFNKSQNFAFFNFSGSFFLLIILINI
jgi:hypothetical protein